MFNSNMAWSFYYGANQDLKGGADMVLFLFETIG